MVNVPKIAEPVGQKASGCLDRKRDEILLAILNEIKTKAVSCRGKATLSEIVENEGAKCEFSRLGHKKGMVGCEEGGGGGCDARGKMMNGYSSGKRAK